MDAIVRCPLTKKMCRKGYDCGECRIFNKAFPNAIWLCHNCIRKGEHTGFYQEGKCQKCGKETWFLMSTK